jgi:hypothetical protein
MYDERERCLELLGMKPGASVGEIKAAYRDLAKVWHPDRFAHDPRLQEKAQDKLKEINEAYEALISGKYTRTNARASRPSTEPAAPHTQQPRSQPGAGKLLWPLMILLACAAVIVFVVSTRLARNDRSDESQSSVTAANPTGQSASDEGREKDEAALNRKEKKSVEKQKAAAIDSSLRPIESQAPVRALPTVTVTIDPTTGQLATAACPLKSSMTYPNGREPRSYCNADHRSVAGADAQPESKKKSGLKSAFNRMAAPARWLKDKVNEPD